MPAVTVDRLFRLALGLSLVYAAFECLDTASDVLGSLLGELFAEAVISTDNVTEGESDHAA